MIRCCLLHNPPRERPSPWSGGSAQPPSNSTRPNPLWMRLLQCGEFHGLPEALAAFRVAQQSLSVDNEAGVYEHQKAIMAELTASRHLQVRRVDSTVGQMLAPTGRLRRRVLFRMSRHAVRHDERLVGSARTAEQRE